MEFCESELRRYLEVDPCLEKISVDTDHVDRMRGLVETRYRVRTIVESVKEALSSEKQAAEKLKRDVETLKAYQELLAETKSFRDTAEEIRSNFESEISTIRKDAAKKEADISEQMQRRSQEHSQSIALLRQAHDRAMKKQERENSKVLETFQYETKLQAARALESRDEQLAKKASECARDLASVQESLVPRLRALEVLEHVALESSEEYERLASAAQDELEKEENESFQKTFEDLEREAEATTAALQVAMSRSSFEIDQEEGLLYRQRQEIEGLQAQLKEAQQHHNQITKAAVG